MVNPSCWHDIECDKIGRHSPDDHPSEGRPRGFLRDSVAMTVSTRDYSNPNEKRVTGWPGSRKPENRSSADRNKYPQNGRRSDPFINWS